MSFLPFWARASWFFVLWGGLVIGCELLGLVTWTTRRIIRVAHKHAISLQQLMAKPQLLSLPDIIPDDIVGRYCCWHGRLGPPIKITSVKLLSGWWIEYISLKTTEPKGWFDSSDVDASCQRHVGVESEHWLFLTFVFLKAFGRNYRRLIAHI